MDLALRLGTVIKFNLALGTVLVFASCGRSPLDIESSLTPASGGARNFSGSRTGGQTSDPLYFDADTGVGVERDASVTDSAPGDAGAPDMGPDLGPFDPGGIPPDCRDDEAPIARRRSSVWLGFRATPVSGGVYSHYLVELTPDGPQRLTQLAPVERYDHQKGGWSGDGRFYGYITDGTFLPDWEVVDTQADGLPTPVPIHEDIHWGRWSPTDSRYFARIGTTLLLGDAANNNSERTLLLPDDGGVARWSPDGRYLAIAFDEDQHGVALVDTSAETLVLERVANLATGSIAWSQGGRYLAFDTTVITGSVGSIQAISTLFVYDTLNPATGVTPLTSEGVGQSDFFQWASDMWLIWIARDERVYFSDVSQTPPTQVLLERQRGQGFVSPSGKCLAYRGFCASADVSSACVRSLPPDAARPGIRLSHENAGNMFWSAESDHLLVMSYSGLWDVTLIGEELVRTPVALAADVGELYSLAYWNPGDSAEWVWYFAPRDHEKHAYLWQRRSAHSFRLSADGFSDQVGDWSPDGRYFVFFSQNKRVLGSARPVKVQEVHPDQLGASWSIDDVGTPLNAGTHWSEFAWQP